MADTLCVEVILRSVSSWLWVLGLAASPLVAQAGKRDAQPSDELAKLAAAEKAACTPGSVEGFRIHTGFGEDASEVRAIEVARQAARKLALESVCAGRPASQCAAITRHLEPWKQPFYNPQTDKACAHVGLNRKWVDIENPDATRLEADLASLADQIRARAGDTPVALPPMVWGSTGCNAGEVGGALSAALLSQLGQGDPVAIARPDNPSAARVALTLEAAGDRVYFAATYTPPGEVVGTPLPGFDFPADLFGLEGGGRCHGDDALGLEGSRRVGAGQRLAWFELGGSGVYCEGDRVSPVLHVNMASAVRVFSVLPDGQALLVWPLEGVDDHVERSLPMGELTLHPSEGGGDERLVAVALPPGASFGPLDAWQAVCHVDRLAASDLPKKAAVGAVGYTVMPFDADMCLMRDVAHHGPQALPDFPTCGEGSWSPPPG